MAVKRFFEHERPEAKGLSLNAYVSLFAFLTIRPRPKYDHETVITRSYASKDNEIDVTK